MRCAQTWRASTCLIGAFFGLPCSIGEVICDVSEEPTAFFRLTLFEADGQGIGTEEIVGFTGNTDVILVFQSSDWPKFPPISYKIDISLPVGSAPT